MLPADAYQPNLLSVFVLLCMMCVLKASCLVTYKWFDGGNLLNLKIWKTSRSCSDFVLSHLISKRKVGKNGKNQKNSVSPVVGWPPCLRQTQPISWWHELETESVCSCLLGCPEWWVLHSCRSSTLNPFPAKLHGKTRLLQVCVQREAHGRCSEIQAPGGLCRKRKRHLLAAFIRLAWFIHWMVKENRGSHLNSGWPHVWFRSPRHSKCWQRSVDWSGIWGLRRHVFSHFHTLYLQDSPWAW